MAWVASHPPSGLTQNNASNCFCSSVEAAIPDNFGGPSPSSEKAPHFVEHMKTSILKPRTYPASSGPLMKGAGLEGHILGWAGHAGGGPAASRCIENPKRSTWTLLN